MTPDVVGLANASHCACGSAYTLRRRISRQGKEVLGRVCRPCSSRWTKAWRDKNRDKFNASRRATYARSKLKGCK